MKECDIVIGFNTNLKTEISQQWVAPNSIQGLFTKKYFDGNHAKLDSEIQIFINENRVVLDSNGHANYGEVFQINTHSNTAYLATMACFNKNGKAESTFENIVQTVLPSLWVYINSHSGKCEHLAMPLLGTGYAGISATRESIVEEILDSYLVACAERLPYKKLTIVLHPNDVKMYNINVGKLAGHLKHECEHFSRKKRLVQTEKIGIPLP